MTTQPPDKSKRRRAVVRTIVVIVILAVAVIGIAVGVGVKKPWSSLATSEAAMLHTIKPVKPGEAMTLSLSSLKVSIEAAKDVLTQKGYLSLTAREAGSYQEVDMPGGWSRPRVIDLAFYDANGKLLTDYVPGNLIDVCFSISDESWSVYYQNEASFQVQYYKKNEVVSQWVPLPTYGRVETQQICGQARHLTLFAIATTSRIEPLLPVTGPLYEGQ